MLYLYDVDDVALDSEFHAEAIGSLEYRIDDEQIHFAKAGADNTALLQAIDLHFGGVSIIVGDFAGPLAAVAMSIPLPTIASEVALRLFHEMRDAEQKEEAFKLLKEDGYITDDNDIGEERTDDNA